MENEIEKNKEKKNSVPDIVIITGLSGSGMSAATNAFEDLGYFCVDNLPTTLIPTFADLVARSHQTSGRVALGVDVREGEYLTHLLDTLGELRKRGHSVEVLFLEASEESLVRRYRETRRRHPLAPEGNVVEGIRAERKALSTMREVADRIVDTSALTVHQLRDELRRLYRAPGATDSLTVLLVSFGYKFGVPADVDMVLDARFLPNPFFVDELRAKTGGDPAVAEYVLSSDDAQTFLRLTDALLDFTLPLYRREGRSYFTLAIGCTGGRHRSVALVDRLAQTRARAGVRVQVQHRDVRR